MWKYETAFRVFLTHAKLYYVTLIVSHVSHSTVIKIYYETLLRTKRFSNILMSVIFIHTSFCHPFRTEIRSNIHNPHDVIKGGNKGIVNLHIAHW